MIKNSLDKQKGMSLIEVLLAIGLLSFIILLLNSMTQNTLVRQQKLKDKNQLTYQMNRILEQINYDLSHAFLISTKDLAKNGGTPKIHTLFSIEKDSPSDTLKMTYNGHQATQINSHESNHSFVVYRVKEDPKNKNQRHLYRGEFPRVPENFKEEPPMKIFAKNVHSIKLTPWNGQNWSTEKWDSTMRETKNKLPKMVRLEVSLWKKPPEKIKKNQKEDQLEHFVTIVSLNQSLDFEEVKTPTKRFKIL